MENSVILCATDFTAQSEAALRYAAQLAHQMDTALLVVHVTPPGKVDSESTVADAQRCLATVATLDGGAAAMPEYVERRGNPADEILKLADEVRPLRIVLGCDGHQVHRDMQAGNTADRVVDRAGCPVMVIENEGLESTAGA